jgi:lysophosphatidate acyltransferase
MSSLNVLVKPLAYVSVPIFLLRAIASSSPRARYPIRLFLFYSSLGLCAVWGMIVAVGLSLTGHRLDVNWVVARSFYSLTSRLLDIKMDLEGEEHLQNRPAILIGNHQSVLDILYLGRFVDMYTINMTPIRISLLV